MDTKTLRPFEPTAAQAKARATFLRLAYIRRGLVDIAALTLGEITRMSGDKRVAEWLADPAFAAWFTEREDFADHANALKEVAIRQLEAMVVGDLGDPRDGFVSEKAKLTAIQEIFKITNAYPTKAKIVFADRDLNNMGEDEVAAKIVAAKAALEQNN